MTSFDFVFIHERTGETVYFSADMDSARDIFTALAAFRSDEMCVFARAGQPTIRCLGTTKDSTRAIHLLTQHGG